MRLIIALTTSTLLATAAFAETEAEGLARVKAFTLEHNDALIVEAEKMQAVAMVYSNIINAHNGDYAAAWAAEPAKLTEAVNTLRAQWLAASKDRKSVV